MSRTNVFDLEDFAELVRLGGQVVGHDVAVSDARRLCRWTPERIERQLRTHESIDVPSVRLIGGVR